MGALQRAKSQGFATRLRKGSRFTLENFITANHGGVAALYYSCPAGSVDTPEEYSALDWKILTPIKDSYPESKRNGVGFSDKLPDWYGFAGSICNFGAGYTGGVIQTCDDCQLRYGGTQTTADWKAEKPPSGAPLGTGQLATIVEVEYQLPADFECPNAVFSWIWHTPHLCIPKVVVDAGAENDVWKFCNKNLQGYYAACATEWQDEIFTNCMDSEVVGDDAAPSPPAATTRPVVPAGPAPAPGSPQGGCAPIGDCGVLGWCDQDKYASWCSGHSSVALRHSARRRKPSLRRCRIQCRVQCRIPRPLPVPPVGVWRPSSLTTRMRASGSPTARTWATSGLAPSRCARRPPPSWRPARGTVSWETPCSRRGQRWISARSMRPRSSEAPLFKPFILLVLPSDVLTGDPEHSCRGQHAQAMYRREDRSGSSARTGAGSDRDHSSHQHIESIRSH